MAEKAEIEEKAEINIRSEEIQDLMLRKPSWLVRWGITTLFLIILMLLFFTWLMRYPDIVYGNITLTVNKPPVKVVNRASGKINQLYLQDNVQVVAGDLIAEIENPMSGKVIYYLDHYIDTLDHALYNDEIRLPLPDTGDRRYGELQNRINDMRGDIMRYNLKLQYDLDMLAIKKLNDRIAYHKDLIEISEDLLKISKEELKNGLYKVEADRQLYEDSVISKYDYIQSQTVYHDQQKDFDQLQLNIIDYHLTLNSLELELENRRYNRDQGFKSDVERILAHREFIMNFINTWKQNYALIAPVDGWLTYLSPVYENQYIAEGESYFAVIQDDNELIGWVDVPSTGYGKIELGQRVNVRLDNYPFHEYGMLQGEVIKKGRIPEQNFYRVAVAFPQGLETSYGYALEFSPQMLGSAEVITADKRLLERIFDSITKLFERGHHTNQGK
jgi:hypothetical protein